MTDNPLDVAQPNVTLKDIARQCAVAKSTVSLALRGDARVRPETTKRILAVATEMGYDPLRNDTARRMAMARHGATAMTHVIGLLCPRQAYTLPFYTRMLQGLLEGFSPSGYNLVTGTYTIGDPVTSLQYLMSRGDLDALIIYRDPVEASSFIERITRNSGFANRPIVSLLFPYAGCLRVLADEENGAYRSARHLLELGHRHLLEFRTDHGDGDQPVSAARWKGVRRAFDEAGLACEPHLHFLPAPLSWTEPINLPHELDPHGTAIFDTQQGDPLVQYLHAHPEITGILAQNDAVALRTWHTLHRAGLRIPEEISLIGFDDTDPMYAADGRNILTTVRMPLMRVGFEAAHLLLRRLAGEVGDDEQIMLPTDLVIRESTAPAPRQSALR